MSYASLESGELCKQKQSLQKKAFEYCQLIEDACNNPCLDVRPAAKPVLHMSTIAALRTFVFGNKAFKGKAQKCTGTRESSEGTHEVHKTEAEAPPPHHPPVSGVLAGPRNADDPNQLNPRMCMDMVPTLPPSNDDGVTSAPTNVRSRMMMESLLPRGPRILILTRCSTFVLIYASRLVLSFLCLCDSYDGVILCILEQKITCLTECCNRGPEQLRGMIGVLNLDQPRQERP